jgi:hypothetical protein
MTASNPRMTQLQMRCHSLQERFEDQSATLKLARESHGDMQVTIGLFRSPLHDVFITLRSA